MIFPSKNSSFGDFSNIYLSQKIDVYNKKILQVRIYMNFPPAFLSELNTLVDLPELIGMYVSDLKKAGSEYKACCPFHSEKTPSFFVSAQKGLYLCRGCGASGNGINFLMENSGLSFTDAVKELASHVGLALPQNDRPEKTETEKQEFVRMRKAGAALSHAQSCYEKCLSASETAKTYLQTRGLTQNSIETFGIGYAPDEWHTITWSRSLNAEQIKDAGLSCYSEKTKKTYDRFRDRIMFPIYDRADRIIGFGGRGIGGQEQKYMNSPETILFDKGRNLYGIKQAIESIRKTGRVFVVEGYMDVVMVSQYGVMNVVASLGTSITDHQMKILFSLCEHVSFCMDGDNAGRKAAWRAAENILPLLDEKHKVDFMFMPDGIDPDDFVREQGQDGFEHAAKETRTLTDYILDHLMQNTDVNNGESLASYLSKANGMADKIGNGLIKLAFQKRIAELAGISLDSMLLMLKEREEKKQNRIVPATVPVVVEPKSTEPIIVQQVVTQAPSSSPEISVAAKLLGIAMLKNKSIAALFDPVFLGGFLSLCEKEILFPMIAYIKANESATDEALLATLAFNPHIKQIHFLLNASTLLGPGFDAAVEAKIIVDGFRKMERINKIVAEASNNLTQENTAL
jgi:DNA primase